MRKSFLPSKSLVALDPEKQVGLAMLLAKFGSPAFAKTIAHSGGTKQTKCYKTVYREICPWNQK